MSRDIETKESAYARKSFAIRSCKNEEIENVLGFAGPGSSIPESCWGIMWLDQNHKSSIAQDPRWQKQVPLKHIPSEETVVCFGDKPVEWDAQAQMIVNCTAYGGEKGHWTMKDGPLGKVEMQNAILTRMVGDFKFLSANHVKVVAKVHIPVLNKWLEVPDDLFKMEMHRTSWGWNRVTTVGKDLPNFIDHSEFLENIFGKNSWLMKMLRVGEKGAMQYPVIPIVDGNGNRTKYYAEYLAFMNEIGCENQLYGAESTGTCECFQGMGCVMS